MRAKPGAVDPQIDTDLRLKLDKFNLMFLDDLAYVTKDQAETSVLFELISARYERRSIMITAPLEEWNRVSHDPAHILQH